MDSEQFSICFFAHSSQLGGAERCLIDLIELLMEKGIQCSVVMPGTGPLKSICDDLNIAVKTYDSSSWWCSADGEQEALFWQILYTLQTDFQDVIQFIREISPDAIYTQTIVSPLGAIVAEYLELPHILGIREYGELDHKLTFALDFQKSMNALYETSQSLLCVSESVGRVVLESNYFTDKVKVNYVKVNIPEVYQHAQFKNFKEMVTIGIFGSISDSKNQVDILKAALLLLQNGYKIKLFIVGLWENRYYKYLNGILLDSSYRDSIVFTGHTKEPIELMSKMDIIVSCSKSEGFGRTLIEAILLKVPIVYANAGAPEEIYENEKHGMAYELCNELDLANKIVYTMEHIEKTRERVENAYEYVVSYFTEERYMGPVLESLYEIKKSSLLREQNYVTELVFSKIPLQQMRKKQKRYLNILENKEIKIVFFGASSVFDKAIKELAKYNVNPDYVCDNDVKKIGQEIGLYKIYSPDELFKKNQIYAVIITSSFISEIKEQLLNYENVVLAESYWSILNVVIVTKSKSEYLLERLNQVDDL